MSMQAATGETVESIKELQWVTAIYDDSAQHTDYVCYLDTKFFNEDKRAAIENLGVVVKVVDSNCNYGKLRVHVSEQ